jgi:hypothetical protein
MPTSFETMFPLFLVLLSRRKKRRVAESVLVSALPLPGPQRSVMTLVQADRDSRRDQREKEGLAREAVAAVEIVMHKPGAVGAPRRLTAAELGSFTRLNELLNQPVLRAFRAKIVV